MAAGYFEAGKTAEVATFELSIRRLPKNRCYVLAAGLAQAVDYLLNLGFSGEDIEYLRGLPQFARASKEFFEKLAAFRFTGDLFAAPEGTPLFSGEPILTVRAPIIEAQIPETYLLAAITFQTLVASKASRIVSAARGRSVVEFGTRRAHTPEAGVLAARAAYIGGCLGTSNVLAGKRFGIPVFGTAAHSWVMSFASEKEAYRQLQKLLGPATVQLVDTYDSLQGVRRAAGLGPPLWGIRLDSGDLLSLSKAAREILDNAGLREAKVMASGDLNEQLIAALAENAAPIDSFGVGTEIVTSADAPFMGAVYKLVELDVGGIKRFTAKRSADKHTLPGAKQIFRTPERDVLARSGECCVENSEALLRPVILNGRLVEPLPDVHAARRHAEASLDCLLPELRRLDTEDTRKVEYSRELEQLIESTRGIDA